MNNTPDFIISNRSKVKDFCSRFDPKETVFTFDFDGTLIHKWFNSFSPIDSASQDKQKVLLDMKKYMVCIEDAVSYTMLDEILVEKSVILPEEVLVQKEKLDFDTFKNKQMNHRWKFTMEKAVERKLPMNNFDLTDLTRRPWAKELVTYLLSQAYTVLIISSWIENLIRAAIKASWFDLNNPNLHIKSNNFYTNSDGYVTGFDPDLITPFTKKHIDYHKYGIQDMKFGIQAGDSLGDSEMISEHFEKEVILNIWFTNGKEYKLQGFSETFDIVLTQKKSSFDDIHKLLFEIK